MLQLTETLSIKSVQYPLALLLAIKPLGEEVEDRGEGGPSLEDRHDVGLSLPYFSGLSTWTPIGVSNCRCIKIKISGAGEWALEGNTSHKMIHALDFGSWAGA